MFGFRCLIQGGPTPRAKQFGQMASSTRKALGDVSNTTKRGLQGLTKQSKPLFTIAADEVEPKTQKKKEKKESIPIFAGGAPGSTDFELQKLAKEIDDCIAECSNHSNLFSFNLKGPSIEEIMKSERRSPDRSPCCCIANSSAIEVSALSRDLFAPESFADCFVELKEEDFEFD